MSGKCHECHCPECLPVLPERCDGIPSERRTRVKCKKCGTSVGIDLLRMLCVRCLKASNPEPNLTPPTHLAALADNARAMMELDKTNQSGETKRRASSRPEGEG